ncbi:THAP domain-containing protein 11 [Salmo salar]|uniref:THAP domain-containing protein 11 n=1 Tax=Salmo salar TaxID=8030 RepID=B5X4H9_SALSA|nr:THAP domain-containing protein 11 [Salmo salar]ACI34210.1 THAP domain-containing protein 11 [Salmo salar]|eukprot:NP_001133956.1 THAP domain-containing protein 11 [Salmo salar]
MPGFTCCVPGCYNNSHRDRELRFYTFPKDTTQREIWLKNISRAGVSGCFSTFQPTTGHRVCSVHFPGGRKTYTVRVPTLFPLRGVNERKNRRGRNRKASASAPVTAPSPGSIVITNVVSTAPGAAETAQSDAVTYTAATDGPIVVQIGPDGEYIGPVNPGAQGDGSCFTAIVSSSTDLAGGDDPSTDAAAQQQTVQYYSVVSNPLDHAYSLTTGTTSAELLRKLNEQRDIIALMEVKMKEMKATIRQLRVTEAKLQEEVRERDRLLSAGAAVKKM